MGIGVSIFLITLGAILKFAITADLEGIDLEAIGVILMVVGGASMILSIAFSMRTGPNPSDRERLYNGERPPPPEV